jgi:ketosteroid isomerase-like protein
LTHGLAGIIRTFAQHVCSQDLDAVLAMYEPDAVYVSGAGERLRGSEIRQFFQRAIALEPEMSGEMLRGIEAGDIALIYNRWSFSGRQCDGTPISSGGVSAVVVRRRQGESWGILIDDPRGGEQPSPAG